MEEKKNETIGKGNCLCGSSTYAYAGTAGTAKVKVKKVTVKSNYGSSVHVAVGKKGNLQRL